MKNLCTIIYLLTLLGCNKSDDGKVEVAPLAPTELKASSVKDKIVLTWKDNSTNETGFKIERKSGSGTWTLHDQIPSQNITTYTDSKVNQLTTYTYRVFSYNTSTNSPNYSNEVIITAPKIILDLDGNSYQVVNIGALSWTKQNLNVSKYRNGDIIPQVTDPVAWNKLTTGAWCYLNNDTANGTKYGKLYNWYAVNDKRGLAPNGWHVASHGDWVGLTNALGGVNVAGDKMKETGTLYWPNPNDNATNSSEFSAIPGGSRNYLGTFSSGIAYWWTSSFVENSSSNSIWTVILNSNRSDCIIVGTTSFATVKAGFSVRCVMNY
jgi:uncharacterized protein (TIGR02145 family)